MMDRFWCSFAVFSYVIIYVLTVLPKGIDGIQWLALASTHFDWESQSACRHALARRALHDAQARACRVHSAAMPHVEAAARATIALCEATAAAERWNCSSARRAPDFSKDLVAGTREQAFVYALSSAALSHTIARACSAGALASCSCGRPQRPQRTQRAQRSFKWGGCDDNLAWAERFAKKFIDAHELAVKNGQTDEKIDSKEDFTGDIVMMDATQATTKAKEKTRLNETSYFSSPKVGGVPKADRSWKKKKRRRYRYGESEGKHRMVSDQGSPDNWSRRDEDVQSYIALANLQNARLGRKSVERSVSVSCKCHGVSGSCSVRTCWRALPALRPTAEALAARARRAAPLRPRRRRAPFRARPPPGRMLYVIPSPDYCEPNTYTGSFGTRGRKCNESSSAGGGSCSTLCCGRGHMTLTSRKAERCRCQYKWCCYVECNVCIYEVDDHYCK